MLTSAATLSFLASAATVLVVGAVLSLVLRNNVQRAWVSILTQAIATTLVLLAAGHVLQTGEEARDWFIWSYPVESVQVHLDALGAFFLSWSLPMTLLGTVYATGYLRPYFQTRNAGVQFALLNITSLSFVMIYTLESATVFLLGWEIAAVAAWLLVIWDYRNQHIRFAGFNYLVSTHIGFFVLVAAFMIIHSATNSMSFDAFAEFMQTPGRLRNITFVLLVVSFGLKSAFFPFHTWLPRAHSAAPAHVSALMSGVIHKAGLFGLLRFTLLMRTPEAWMGWFLIGFSALSVLMGVLYTTSQRDLKRLLGYSSTENVGIAGIGFGLGYLGLAWNQPTLVLIGFTGGMLHLLNHAFFKCLLFYAAGAVYRATHSVDIERLGGLARRMPWTATLFLIGAIAISAMPPLNGFVSELVIYSGLFDAHVSSWPARLLLCGVAALLAFSGGVSTLSMTRAFGLAFLGSPRDSHIHVEGDGPMAMRLTMVVHAIGVVVLGCVPLLGVRYVSRAVGLLVRLQSNAESVDVPAVLAGPIPEIAAVVSCLLGLLIAGRWLLGRRHAAARHVTWACGYVGVSPRMQYTGASFSSQFASIFDNILLTLRREKLPDGYFPEKTGHLNTHCVDAVERRIFEALGEGEGIAARVVARLSDEPRFGFGLGLMVLGAIALAALAGGP